MKALEDDWKDVESEPLLPCPLCGAEKATVQERRVRLGDGNLVARWRRVSCKTCGATTAEYGPDGGEVERWNCRHVWLQTLDCPVCGSSRTKVAEELEGSGTWIVSCLGCGFHVSGFNCKADGVEAWNRRRWLRRKPM